MEDKNKRIFNQCFLESLYEWDLIISPYISKKLENKKSCIIDVGSFLGIALSSFYLIDKNYELIGIEPNYEKIISIKYPLISRGKEEFSKESLIRKNIKILEIDGNSFDLIPYNRADVIIKTFNLSVNWNDILKHSNAQFLISANKDVINDKRYELVENIEKFANNFLIYKKIN